MPRCTRGLARPQLPASIEETPDELADFWEQLPLAKRRELLRVDKRALFQTIRAQYCSRCFGLFVLRFEELRGASPVECEACATFYVGMVVENGQTLTLEDSILKTQPFKNFSEAKQRERERELQFMTGGICGNGWARTPGNTMCNLHTSSVPVEALMEYWCGLPEEHHAALFQLREEDFAAELDAHLKYQLRICRDCRGNVYRAYRELKAKAGVPGAELPICEGHSLSLADGAVVLSGVGTSEFFERAEEVEDYKGGDGELEDGYDEGVRHAETPELAREALADCAVLIFKGQVEVAFREQTAGHNALLLFVHLALSMMEERLRNAFKELRAKEAEAELLELVAKDEKAQEVKRARKKGKKKGGKGEAPLCGCGAVCDAACQTAQQAQQQRGSGGGSRAASPARHPTPPRTPPRPPKLAPPDAISRDRTLCETMDAKEPGTAVPAGPKAGSPGKGIKGSRSTLGHDLMSPRRDAVSRAPPPSADNGSPGTGGGGWETIPAAGKRRSSNPGGKGAKAEPAPRGASPDAPRRPPAAQPLTQHHTPHIIICPRPPAPSAAVAGANGGALSASGSPIVRAVPIITGAHGGAAHDLPEEQARGSPAAGAQHVAPKVAVRPVRAQVTASGASGFFGDPVIQQHPVQVPQHVNPWHAGHALSSKLAVSGGKPMQRPVHSVHVTAIGRPLQQHSLHEGLQAMQLGSTGSGAHDPFSLFHHSPLAHATQLADQRVAASGPAQQPVYQLFGGGPAQHPYPLTPLLPVGL